MNTCHFLWYDRWKVCLSFTILCVVFSLIFALIVFLVKLDTLFSVLHIFRGFPLFTFCLTFIFLTVIRKLFELLDASHDFLVKITSKSYGSDSLRCLQNYCNRSSFLSGWFPASPIKSSFIFLREATNGYGAISSFQSYNFTSLLTTQLRSHYAISRVDLWYPPEKILWNFSGTELTSGSLEYETTWT